jgi:hypothetical protein
MALVALIASVMPASAQLAGECARKNTSSAAPLSDLHGRRHRYAHRPRSVQRLLEYRVPVRIGGGMVIFPWLEVNGTYNKLSFSNNDIASKEKVEYEGVADIKGASVHTTMFWGSARFVAVPHARTNPYIEIGVGGFKSKGDDLTIDDPQKNFHQRNT